MNRRTAEGNYRQSDHRALPEENEDNLITGTWEINHGLIQLVPSRGSSLDSMETIKTSMHRDCRCIVGFDTET